MESSNFQCMIYCSLTLRTRHMHILSSLPRVSFLGYIADVVVIDLTDPCGWPGKKSIGSFCAPWLKTSDSVHCFAVLVWMFRSARLDMFSSEAANTRLVCLRKSCPRKLNLHRYQDVPRSQYITQNLRGDFLVKRKLKWPHWSFVSTYLHILLVCTATRSTWCSTRKEKKHLESLRTKLNSQIARRLLSPMDRCFKITRYSKK